MEDNFKKLYQHRNTKRNSRPNYGIQILYHHKTMHPENWKISYYVFYNFPKTLERKFFRQGTLF